MRVLVCAVGLLITLLSDAVVGRVVTSLDVGWRFQLGDAGYELPCNTSAFTTNVTGTRCSGATPIFVSSAELCELACCGNPDCTDWQWCEQPCSYVTCSSVLTRATLRPKRPQSTAAMRPCRLLAARRLWWNNLAYILDMLPTCRRG